MAKKENTNVVAAANQTVAHDNIYAALVAAQAEFSPVVKDAANPFFKSEYATLAAVTAMLRPVLARHGLGYTCGAVVSAVGGTDSFVWRTTIYHTSGGTIAVDIPFSCADHKPQGFGSAITYFRRYGLQAAFGVVVVGDDTEDDGNRANGNKTTSNATVDF